MATYTGDSTNETYTGTTGPDTISGNGGDDILHGDDGADIIAGGPGVDQVYGDAGDDIFDVHDGDIETGDLFDGGADSDTLLYLDTSGIDLSGATITGVERLVSVSSAKIGLTIAQLSGFSYVNAVVQLTTTGYISLNAVAFQVGDLYLANGGINYVDLSTTPGPVAMTIHGGDQTDTILGSNSQNDTLYGGGGDDLLDGNGGDDLMYGGAGNDQYYVKSAGDQVFENAGEGVDKIFTNLSSYTLAANFENLQFFGAGAFSGTGNDADNIITGGLGGDTLRGGAGRDELYGAEGNDILIVGEGDYVDGEVYDGGATGTNDRLRYTGTSDVDFSTATITAIEGLEITTSATVGLTIAQLQGFKSITGAVRLTEGGTVSVGGVTFQAGSSLTLSDAGNSVDFTGSPTTAITVHGGAGDDAITGTSASDTLYGGGGSDSLDGGAGGDILVGGTGNDYYTVDNAGDQVYESAGEGYDNVYTSTSSYTLPDNVEGLIYIGGGYFTGIANDQSNNIVGGDFGNNIDGRGGNDFIYGGAGADTLRGGGGTDFVRGYAGNDVFQIAEGDVAMGDYFDGGADADQIYYLGTIDLDLSVATIVGVETLYADWGTTVSLTVAQLEGFSNVDAVVRLVDGGTVDLTGTALPKGVLYLSDYGNTVDLSTAVSTASAVAIYGGAGQDVITGSVTGSDSLHGGGGDDVLDGLGGGDFMSGGTGDDTFYVDSTGDQVVENAGEGHDHVITTLGTYSLAGTEIEDLTFAGTGGFVGYGNAYANVITGGSGGDVLSGGGGADTLYGNDGDDFLYISEGDDVVGATFDGGADTDSLVYMGHADLDLSSSTLTSIEKLDSVYPATISLTVAQLESLSYVGALVTVKLVDGGAVDLSGVTLAGSEIYLSDYGNTIDLSSAAGTSTGMTVHGGAEQDVITGTATGNDTLYGGGGDDVLDGLAGDDLMIGGTGDDTYHVDSTGDQVTENAGEGDHDLVVTTLQSYWISGTEIEDLTYVGSGGFSGYGDGRANIITGGNDVDWFFGGGGADTLYGNGGDDSFFLYELEVIDGGTFDGGAGTDTFKYLGISPLDLSLATLTSIEQLDSAYPATISLTVAQLESLSYVGANVTLKLVDGGAVDLSGVTIANGVLYLSDYGNSVDLNSAHTAPLTVYGGADADSIRGSDAVNDTLFGGGGNDVLDGLAGADVMTGGDGDDTYFVDHAGDQVIETDDEGIDLVETTLTSYTLGAHVDDVAYTGTADFAGTGNDLDNYIDGDAGNDLLKGLDGDDVLSGWDGNDQLEGGAGADMLDGGDGNDTMIGGTGDDAYFVHDAGDVVVEAADEGFDGVFTDLDRYTLGANVEGLIYAGDAGFIGIGNELDNIVDASYALDDSTLKGMAGDDILVGGLGNDRLNGGTGADYMEGGDGDDTYIVDDAGDLVVECGCSGSGTDTVQAAIDYTLGENVENLTLLNGAIAGTGNELDNVLIGNGSHNILDGGEGADTMDGGSGDDTYFVDNELDVILDSSGVDTVKASVRYTLGAGVAIEVLRTTDDAGTDAIDLTGNELANILIGNAGDNVLDGGAGVDRLEGLGGDDTYRVDDAADVVVEAADGGYDRVEATSGSYTLGANVEELVFTGTGFFYGWGNEGGNVLDAGTASGTVLRGMGGDDTLLGGAGNDKLDGGTGADVMIGGAGDDIYVVDNAGDDVQENGGGNDTVRSQISYTLGAGVETLILTGGASNSATGNALDNLIVGNGGHNLIDGGAGADQMEGGAGDDTYIVDNAGDVTIDTAGSDTVKANLNYALALGSAIETLRTWDDAGTDPISLVGNEFANRVIGNAGGNYLNGGAGNDRLEGLGGDDRLDGGNDSDTLIGGAGADTFAFASTLGAGNVDTIVDFVHGVDRIELDATIFRALTGTSLSADAFGFGTSATTAAQRIVYDKATGNLWYDADGSGSGAAVKFATLANHPADLSASDFVVTGSFGAASLVLDIDDVTMQFDALDAQGADAPSPDFAPEISDPHAHWALSGDDGLVSPFL